MKYKYFMAVLTVFIFVVFSSPTNATVEWSVKKTMKLEQAPIDVAVSKNGKWIFVLTEEGSILIYSSDGNLKDKITVGQDIDAIKPGPKEDTLFLTSKTNKTVKSIVIDFVYEIEISGSPLKGSPDAPVLIAVFQDFQ